MRSGSASSTNDPAGIRSVSSSSSDPTSTGMSDSIPSTGMPSARRSSSSRSWGAFWCTVASAAARSRTGAVSSSSRHPGASSSSTGPTERWSATAKSRSSVTSSPQNSTRTGCSAVGGKTSTRPPRTANSPRAVTISTRVYASSTRRSSSASKSWTVPTRSRTGSSRPSPGAIGWMRLRTAATTIRGADSGRARRRKMSRRRPTVSDRGESRSCGRVSQDGRTATSCPPIRSAAARPRSSASRSVAVTARTGRAVPPSVASDSMAARNGRSADGPSTPTGAWSATAWAASSTARRSGSVRADRSRPESWGWMATVLGYPSGRAHADRPLPGTIHPVGASLPAYARPPHPPASRRPLARESAPVGARVGAIPARESGNSVRESGPGRVGRGARVGASRARSRDPPARVSRTGTDRLAHRNPDSRTGNPDSRTGNPDSRAGMPRLAHGKPRLAHGTDPRTGDARGAGQGRGGRSGRRREGRVAGSGGRTAGRAASDSSARSTARSSWGSRPATQSCGVITTSTSGSTP